MNGKKSIEELLAEPIEPIEEPKADPKFMCGTLAINDRPWEGPEPHPRIHREAFFEITAQLIEFVEEALQNKADVWKPIRIMVQAEHLIDLYTKNHFDLTKSRSIRRIWTKASCGMRRRRPISKLCNGT
jgi:hypothetical protein